MSLKNKLAIFDLDGTLFDTKDVNYTMEKIIENFFLKLFQIYQKNN